MKILITGGAGFVGSHLAERLLRQGHEVHAYDNLSTGSLLNVRPLRAHRKFRLTTADILEEKKLETAIRSADQIYHLAAAVGVRWIMENPVETIITNVRGTENVLAAAAKHGKPTLVTSTSEVYGKAMEVGGRKKLAEGDDWTLGPTRVRRWAYACSKAMDEFLARAYFDEKGLPVVIVRLFNTVGPRQTGRYGMVIPNFVQRALLHEPIPIHGDGKQTRSFTHVADAVRAMTELMKKPKARGEVVNIGSGEVISIRGLAEKVLHMTGSQSRLKFIPYHQIYAEGFEDMRARTPDIAKLRRLTGYRPEHSLDDILADVIDHFRHDHGN